MSSDCILKVILSTTAEFRCHETSHKNYLQTMGKQVSPHPISQTERIVIAGGGLAGLSTALGLSKLGYHVSIIEKRTEWLQQGSAFGLAANGRKALAELFHNASSLARLLEKGMYVEAYDSYLLLWYVLRDALLEEVQKCTLIDVHMGKTITTIDDTSNMTRVKIGLEDVHSGKVEMIQGCLFVAADGVHSNVRELMGLEPAKVCVSSNNTCSYVFKRADSRTLTCL